MLDGGQNMLSGVIESYWVVVGRRGNRRKMLPVYFLIFYVCDFGCEGVMFFQRKIQHEVLVKIFFGLLKHSVFSSLILPHDVLCIKHESQSSWKRCPST